MSMRNTTKQVSLAFVCEAQGRNEMASSCVADEEDSNSECSNSTEILIIGAGLAGLSSANVLVKHGVRDFNILEARNRIGGRVISISLGPHRIELGAMFIHGVLGNPIYELALSNKLININLDRKKHNVIAVTDQGQRIPLYILKEVYEIYFYFLKRCEEYFLCRIPVPHDVRSVGEHLEADISSYLKGMPPEERRMRRMVFNHLLSRETCISGCHSMTDVDLADFGTYTELPGGNLQIDKGFSSILECLTAPLPHGCIHKEHTVKKIRWNVKSRQTNSNASCVSRPLKEHDGVNFSESNQEKSDFDSGDGMALRNVEVECDNGKMFYADHVLVTIPLGVLKEKAAQLFEPPLPQYKLDAIGRLSFGTVNKIFLEYERPFLLPDLSEIIILWDSDHSATSSGFSSSTWYKKIYSFTKINEVILLTWLSGEEAVFAESLSAEAIAETCTDILRKFLKDPYIPKPMRVVRTRWHGEVNTRGAYTAIAVGSSQDDIENLGKPIYGHPNDSKPVLLFAGEATHPSFYSTTHGALLSGRTAAELLLEPSSPNLNGCQSDLGELSSWVRGINLT